MPGKVRIISGNGGLPKVVVSTSNGEGEMYLHGAHVTSWVPKAGAEVLYLSPRSDWEDGRAIRGGVPVCFPWFADKADDSTAPAHGFVRTKEWKLESVELLGDKVVVSMSTESDDNTRKWWPFDFRAVCRASFGTHLKIELMVANTGESSCVFEEALHAYFAVGDAESIAVQGLGDTFFIDKTDKRKEKKQSGDLRILSETDRVYLDTQHEVELLDAPLQRRLTVHKEDSFTTVVWNPLAQKAAALHDLGADEWRKFVCIETSNVVPFAVQLAPGETHTMTAVVSSRPLQ